MSAISREISDADVGTMGSLPSWAQWSIIGAAVLLSPVLAFLTAVAAEALIGLLVEAGVLALLAFIAAGTLGCFLFRKARLRLRGGTSAEDEAGDGRLGQVI